MVKVTAHEHKSIEKLMNVENEWGNCVANANIEGSVPRIELKLSLALEAHGEQEGK